jgi:hypothetical protein
VEPRIEGAAPEEGVGDSRGTSGVAEIGTAPPAFALGVRTGGLDSDRVAVMQIGEIYVSTREFGRN